MPKFAPFCPNSHLISRTSWPNLVLKCCPILHLFHPKSHLFCPNLHILSNIFLYNLGCGSRGPKDPYARCEAPSLELAWGMPDGHHPSRVAKSGSRAQTQQAQKKKHVVTIPRDNKGLSLGKGASLDKKNLTLQLRTKKVQFWTKKC